MPHGEDDAKGTLRLVYWAGLISAVFALVDFYFQLPAPAGFGPQYIWIGNSIYRRAQGFFYESSTLGNVSAFFLVFIAASLARPRESPVRRSLLAVGAVLFMGSLLFSFSRGSLVGLIAALAAFGVAQGSRKLALRLGLLLGGLSAVSLVVLFVIAPDLLRFYAVRTVASVQLLISGNERALSGRAETWRVLTTYLANHPQYAVFGVGYKTLPYSDFIGQPTVADNGYLSALVETGMVGLAALLLLHFAVLRLAWKARGNLYGLWIFSFWCGEAVQMLSGDLFTYWRVLPLYFWTLAMAVRERQSRLP
jgi:O-antigen ligase